MEESLFKIILANNRFIDTNPWPVYTANHRLLSQLSLNSKLVATTNKTSLAQQQKIIISGLLIATAGVLIQIFSSVPYPKLPFMVVLELCPPSLKGGWWTARISALRLPAPRSFFMVFNVFTNQFFCA